LTQQRNRCYSRNLLQHLGRSHHFQSGWTLKVEQKTIVRPSQEVIGVSITRLTIRTDAERREMLLGSAIGTESRNDYNQTW
jgi:hypothetical protein